MITLNNRSEFIADEVKGTTETGIEPQQNKRKLEQSLPLTSSDLLERWSLDSNLNANEISNNYDPNRRSSLGAESLLEHDMSEENGNLDNDITDIVLLDAHLGLEYVDDIFMLNRYKEQLLHPRRFIEDQPQVTEYMRCTLINWLIKVNNELRFGHETIFLAVSLTDRFLTSTPIAQDCLQLLAVCALFVASKLEECSVPRISTLVSLCGSTYRHHHFQRMETLLLTTLRFELHFPTSWFFVTYLTMKSCQLAPLDKQTLTLGRSVIETCLGSYQVCQFFPSEQGASALIFSYLVLYSPNLVYPDTNANSERGHSELSDDCRNIFEKLSTLNAASASLSWTLKEIFSMGELQKIINCLYHIRDYMKPFLQSSILGNEPSGCGTSSSLGTGNIGKENGCQSSSTYWSCTRSVYNEDRERIERINVHEEFETNSKYVRHKENSLGVDRCKRCLHKCSNDKNIGVAENRHVPLSPNQDQVMEEEEVSSLNNALRETDGKVPYSEWDVT